MTDWIMVIITTVYVIATIIICISNYKSAKLARESNEINVISKIVEIEQSRLSETKNAIDNFIKNASFDFQFTSQMANSTITYPVDNKSDESLIRIIAIKHSFQLFERCILVDNDSANDNYKQLLRYGQCFYNTSIDICKWMNEEYDGSESLADVNNRLKKVVEVQSTFFEAKEKYILSREEKLSKALLGNLSLSEVKKMFSNNCYDSKEKQKI